MHASRNYDEDSEEESEESKSSSKSESNESVGSNASRASSDPGYKPTWRERIEELTLKDSFIFLIEHTEIICYVLFVICFTTMAILGRTAGDYSYTQTQSLRGPLETSMQHQDLTKDIVVIDDIYSYFEDVIFPIVFEESRLNGSHVNNFKLRYYVNTGNARILGGVRIKQSRWKNEAECKVSPSRFPMCYDKEAAGKEEFAGNGHWAQVPFEYWDSTVLDDQAWTGKYGTYPGGGYVIDMLLSQGLHNATLILQEMKDGEWIDGGTRALFIDFNAFDPSTLLHTVVRVAFEMPTGGIYATTEVKTWKFLRYKSGWGVSLGILHVIFLLFIVGFTIQMGYEMYKEGVISLFAGETMTSYWSKTQWRKLDVTNMIIFYVLLGLFVRNDFYMQNLIDLASIDEFHSYRSLQYLFLGEVYCQAIAGFFLLIKSFKYLKLHSGFRFFYAMADASAPHLAVFLVILMAFFSSFAILGFLFFGSDVDDFRSFWTSVANMIRYTVSELDYDSVTASSRLWGSIYWFSWSLLMILVLVNVFVGIIGQAYTEAHENLGYEEKETDDDKSNKVINIIQRFGAARIQDMDEDGDGQIDAEELAAVYPITVDEARAFIAHFDEDGDGTLDQNEFQKLIESEMKKKDEERKRKEQEEIERKQKERQERIERAKAAAQGKTVSKKEFKELKKEIKQMYKLMEAALNTTVDGARAVKRVKLKHNMSIDKGGKHKYYHSKTYNQKK